MIAANDSFSLESYRGIVKRIAQACQKSKRDVQEICLIGVTKTKPAESIIEAHNAGLCDFGENYVQEFIAKNDQLKNLNLHWHFIGHLQKNKAKNVIGKIDLLHSLDSKELALIINKEAEKAQITQNCLLQIHMGAEETKFGIPVHDAKSILQEISQLKNIEIQGLMLLPPFFEDIEQSRPYFKELRCLRDQINQSQSYRSPLSYLSMGMSHDFAVAIEEGATHIRIGTALFGARQS